MITELFDSLKKRDFAIKVSILTSSVARTVQACIYRQDINCSHMLGGSVFLNGQKIAHRDLT